MKFFDLVWRVLIIFSLFSYLKPQINISEFQWLLLGGLFICGYLYTLAVSPLKSLHYHLIGVILAPLGEELLFRGLLLSLLPGEIMTKTVIVSIIFGLYHLKNIHYLTFLSVAYQVIYATILGFPLAWLAISTKSLFLPIMLHSVNNILAATVTMRYFPRIIRQRRNE